MKTSLCYKLPDLPQHIILEYLGYKLRLRKYIKSLPKDLPIYQLLWDRPKTEEFVFTEDDHPVNIIEHYDDNGDFYYVDEENGKTFFRVMLVTKVLRGDEEEAIEIAYSCWDRWAYTVKKYRYTLTHPDYAIDYTRIDEEIH